MADDEQEYNLPVITAFSFKGGAGKTTLLALLGSAALVSGYRVIFIDTDATKNLASWHETAVKNDLWPDNARFHHALDVESVIQIIDDAYDSRSADLVLLDSPGFATKALDEILGVSDFVFSPIQMSQPDAVSAEATRAWMLEYYDRLGEGVQGPVHCFVANNIKNASRPSMTERKYLDHAREQLPLVKTIVPNRAAMALMTDTGPLGELIKRQTSDDYKGQRVNVGHCTDLLKIAIEVMNDILANNVWEKEDA